MVANAFALSPTFIQPALLLRLWENVGFRSAHGIVKKVQGLLQTLSAQRRRARLNPDERLCAELFDACVLRVGAALGDVQDEDTLQNALDTLTEDRALETARSALNQAVARLLAHPSSRPQAKLQAGSSALVQQARHLSAGHKAKLSNTTLCHARAIQQLHTEGRTIHAGLERILVEYKPYEHPFKAPEIYAALVGAQRADLCAFALVWLYEVQSAPIDRWLELALWEELRSGLEQHLALLLAALGMAPPAELGIVPLDLDALAQQADESEQRFKRWFQEAREHGGPVYHPLGEPLFDD